MWPFGSLSDLREVVPALDRARAASRADDELPIDEPRDKLAVPPGVSLGDVRERLSESLRVRPAVKLAVPALHRDDGDLAAAAQDEVLWMQLRDNGSVQDG